MGRRNKRNYLRKIRKQLREQLRKQSELMLECVLPTVLVKICCSYYNDFDIYVDIVNFIPCGMTSSICFNIDDVVLCGVYILRYSSMFVRDYSDERKDEMIVRQQYKYMVRSVPREEATTRIRGGMPLQKMLDNKACIMYS